MNDQSEIKRVVIAKWMNRSRFIQIEDALDIGKVRIWLGAYVKGKGMQENAYHFIDVDDVRVVLDDMAQGRALVYKEYKGSVNGQVVSRVLSVKQSGEVYWFEVSNGPGRKSPTGAVMPAGKPTSQVSVGLPVYEARKLAHAVLAYLRAWEVRNLLIVKRRESGVNVVRVQRVMPGNTGFAMNQDVARVSAG